MRRAKKQAGERFRDEKRTDGGPRMHGRQWHDHEEPRDLEPEVMTAPDAVPEVESGGDREGMGKGGVPRKTKGRTRQTQRSPRGKGVARPNATGTGRGKRRR